jgi:hypothetical protein
MINSINEEGTLQDFFDMISSPINNSFETLRDISNRILGRKRPEEDVNIERNIAKSARGLTALFPVLVTEATTLEHAVMISKSIERKAITLLQMLFAANQITTATNAKSYLKNFHNNIDSSIDLSGMDVDDVIEYTNKLTEGTELEKDVIYQGQLHEAINFVYDDTKKSMNRMLSTNFRETVPIHEYVCRGNVLNEINIYNQGGNTEVRTTYDGDPNDMFTRKRETQVVVKEPKDITSGDIKDAYEAINKGIIKTDVAKSNESVPSLMIVNFVSLVPGTDHKVVSTAVIGVKAVLHYVESENMVNRIIMKNSDKNGLLNLIRATTGEIKFFKDFLFSIDRAKIDALGRAGKGSNSKIWKILELRADRAYLNRKSGSKNTDCAAITSLIINKNEVEIIKKYHRIDLMKPGTLLAIMRGYNLMCAAIIDEVGERVDFMYDDGDSRFETLSFMSLERDDGNGQLKKVINVLAQRR